MESSLCEKPERHASRRLSDHLTFQGQKQKVHSLVDKVYSRENLKLAWERVRANRGASGADRVTIGDFEANLDGNLERLHRELREQTYKPQAVRRLEIPKRGAPGKTRPLGIPSVYDRVCQQALANRLEPIFEKVFLITHYPQPSNYGTKQEHGAVSAGLNDGAQQGAISKRAQRGPVCCSLRNRGSVPGDGDALALAIGLRLPGLRRPGSQPRQDPRALPVHCLSTADILDRRDHFRRDQSTAGHLVSRHVPPHSEQGRHLQH